MKRGKIIRDAVHGDIYIPQRFLAVIDTPEFQRLRRIKQLSIANMIFPSADHTRFSHSIGTFYIMTLIIEHLKSKFGSMHLDDISKDDEDIVLLAALLHDLGHGPFSHAFEGVLPEIYKNMQHEEWTKKIIECPETEIYKAIVKNFGEGTPQKVVNLINKQRNVKKSDEQFVMSKVDLFEVLSSLISSQLDADRMDYLLRDSLHCGVTFGKIDIQRIISSIEITVYDNKYYVCVPEKFISDIEAYVLARYQMQKVVYYHDFKIEMEQLIKKVIQRAYYLFTKNQLEFCPDLLYKLFVSGMNVTDYVQMDDALFQYAFSMWSNEDDEILNKLSKYVVGRIKWKKIHAIDNSHHNLSMMKERIVTLFRNHEYQIDNLDKEFFWMEKEVNFKAYNNGKENIWIRSKNGVVDDISEKSLILNNGNSKKVVFENIYKLVFFNYDLLENLKIEGKEELKKELKDLFKEYNIRNTIEIEKKYTLASEQIFDEVLNYFNKIDGWTVKEQGTKEQIDYYYDTSNMDLHKSNRTLRIREKNEKYEMTIKTPTPTESEKMIAQSERFEHKKIVKDRYDLDDDFIKQYLSDINDSCRFRENIIVKNTRRRIDLVQDDIKFEMVFDDVKYCAQENDRSISDFQVEIELKSDYQHRVNLKLLTDRLEKEVQGLQISTESKYKRGYDLLYSSSKNR